MSRLLTILIVGLICEAIGVVLLSRGLKEISGWLFSADDIQAPEVLAQKLRQHADPVSELVWQSLSPTRQAALLSSQAPPADQKQLLADALNDLLRRAPSYDAQRYAHVTLSHRARELSAKATQNAELVELNRLLLEDAYSDALRKQSSQANGPAQILQLIGRGVTNTHILLGVFFEALFFVGLLMLMSKADVSFVWPLTSLSFVVTTIAAKLYLHENVSPLRWSGVCLIMMGAALITWTEKQHAGPASRRPAVQSPGPSAAQ